MTHRIVWPITVLFGLLLLAVGIGSVPAQRQPGAPFWGGMPPQPRRFAVAHATATKVIILDTATGKLYRGNEDDFLKLSESPKVGVAMPTPFPRTDKDRAPRVKDAPSPRPKDGPRETRDERKDKEK